MTETSGTKETKTTDRNSANSVDALIDPEKRPTSSEKDLEADGASSTESVRLAKPIFGGPSGKSSGRVAVWYISICLLFIIAFLSLVLSVLYYINDSSSETVVKLYGICAASVLAVLTFVIVCLNCCYDGRLTDHEEETLFRTSLDNAAKEKKSRRRRRRRELQMTLEKATAAQSLALQQPRGMPVFGPHPHPYQHRTPHHRFVYHIQPHVHHTHQEQHVCRICHESHTSTHNGHSLSDVAVDTSDKFEPLSKRRRTTALKTSSSEVQTVPITVDAHHSTQTDRVEGTQTSSMELSGIPNNVTEIIHETTILKAPRGLLATLKKSLIQQEKELAITAAVTDSQPADV